MTDNQSERNLINPVFIAARDIPDAWFQCLYEILRKSSRYTIQRGSYEGQVRLEFDFITVQVNNAYAEPYDTMLPEIPPALGLPNPVAAGYIEQYLPYLLTDYVEPGEQYTYGSRIVDQAEYWAIVLRETPNTNQAVLQIARPEDHKLSDPPCLRHIDMRIKNGRLVFFPYFRSWDLWGGFPANLAGIAVLQKTMADEIGVGVGPIIASSKGLHLYGYAEDLAKIRCMEM